MLTGSRGVVEGRVAPVATPLDPDPGPTLVLSRIADLVDDADATGVAPASPCRESS
jgi:hypothetical protein